jgi:hypothetical protein
VDNNHNSELTGAMRLFHTWPLLRGGVRCALIEINAAWVGLLLIAFSLTACEMDLNQSVSSVKNVTEVTQPSKVPTATGTLSPAPSITHTPRPTLKLTSSPTKTLSPTITSTPEPLAVFTTKELRPGVAPLAYLDEPCTYLKHRWEKGASPPGTVVLPVMFHSIVQNGRTVTDPKDISEADFQIFVQYAQSLDFKTITTAQLLSFLENNTLIPPRSMILILDDRRPGVVREHFLPVLEANDWTLTLAYIADPKSMQWATDELKNMATDSGRLDVQSHGYSGQLYMTEQTSLEAAQAEIWDSTSVLEAAFGQRPLAFIWPGGNFSAAAVQVAREGGYRLGFTAFSRGPLLFNWVPLGELERAVADPLMLLPRAWSNSVNVNLNQAVQISDQAVQFARENFSIEAAFYRTYCNSELPPVESILGHE